MPTSAVAASPGVAWLQLCDDQLPSAEAAVAIISGADIKLPAKAYADQKLGVIARAGNVDQTIRFALDNNLAVVVLDATGNCSIAGELKGAPDLALIRDASHTA